MSDANFSVTLPKKQVGRQVIFKPTEACNVTLSGSRLISLLSEIKFLNKTNEIQVNNKHPSKELRTSTYEVLLNSALGSGDSRYIAKKTKHIGLLSFFLHF